MRLALGEEDRLAAFARATQRAVYPTPALLTVVGQLIAQAEQTRSEVGAQRYARPTPLYPANPCGTTLTRFNATSLTMDSLAATMLYTDVGDIHCPDACGPASSPSPSAQPRPRPQRLVPKRGILAHAFAFAATANPQPRNRHAPHADLRAPAAAQLQPPVLHPSWPAYPDPLVTALPRHGRRPAPRPALGRPAE